MLLLLVMAKAKSYYWSYYHSRLVIFSPEFNGFHQYSVPQLSSIFIIKLLCLTKVEKTSIRKVLHIFPLFITVSSMKMYIFHTHYFLTQCIPGIIYPIKHRSHVQFLIIHMVSLLLSSNNNSNNANIL